MRGIQMEVRAQIRGPLMARGTWAAEGARAYVARRTAEVQPQRARALAVRGTGSTSSGGECLTIVFGAVILRNPLRLLSLNGAAY